MADEKPRLIQPSVIAELRAENSELKAQIASLQDGIDSLKLDIDRQRHTLNLILGKLSQLADRNSTVCPF